MQVFGAAIAVITIVMMIVMVVVVALCINTAAKKSFRSCIRFPIVAVL